MKDMYTRTVLTVIALCLSVLVVTSTGKYFIEDAQASSCDEDRIIYSILSCLDGSSVSDSGYFSTSCNG